MICSKSAKLPVANAQSLFMRENWGIQTFGIPALWNLSKGEGINVAVLDSGIAFNHPDFVQAISMMKDFTNSKAGVYDITGHGTHVAGIIGSRNPKVGLASEIKLLIGKIINDEGTVDIDATVDALYWAIENKANIINLSIEAKKDYLQLKQAVEEANKAGCIVVCAAGNAGPKQDSIQYPAKYKSTIAVAAIDRNFKLRVDASTGPELDLVAPGVDIYSADLPYGYTTRGGSSMAAPFVSGVIALMLAREKKNPRITTINLTDGIRECISNTAFQLGNPEEKSLYGMGLIHPQRMIV
ncbi:S8 family peptidase [Chondrinema litorale]|uniref:S8 family peptidase n=1 Tax=Chondrinema litorale TaxID=2994555 RepID=UPI002543779E|nr:S8 family serine peptidase [Chondrinema litorale]UZR99691.1 S8 family serine peptidase [Chondrinema litorale]